MTRERPGRNRGAQDSAAEQQPESPVRVADRCNRNEHLRAAELEYIERGWRVFPLARCGKLPAIHAAHPEGDPLRGKCKGECGREGHGVYDATRDLDRINEWDERFPEHNIGVPTGDAFDVLDVDRPDAARHANELGERLAGVDSTVIGGPVVVTAHGWHHYVLPTGRGNRTCVAGIDGLDWRGKGGYVVAPPSVHPSGHVYAWGDVNGVLCGPERPLEPPPAGVYALLEHKPLRNRQQPATPVVFAKHGTAAGLIRKVSDATEGNRNAVLYWAATTAVENARVGKLPNLDDVLDELHNAAVATGLGDHEVERTIRSAIAGKKAA